MKEKKLNHSFIFIIIGIILSCLGLFFLVSALLTKKDNVTEKEKREISPWNGIYSYNDADIRIYMVNDLVYFYYQNNTANDFGTFLLKKDNMLIDNEDNPIVFVYLEEENKISFQKSNLYDGEKVTFNKTSDYTVDKLISDYLLDNNYKDTKYNGIYTKGDIEIYMIQINDKYIKIKEKDSYYGSIFYTIGENNKYISEFEKEITITFSKNGVIFKGLGENLDGEYERKNTLDDFEICDNFIFG